MWSVAVEGSNTVRAHDRADALCYAPGGAGLNRRYHIDSTITVSVDTGRRTPPVTPAAPPLETESTVQLLAHVRAGNLEAREVLFARCLPALRRWARGRLPVRARDLLQTEDIVQDALLSVFQRLDSFESRHQGALQAYLRQTALNRIRDAARRVATRPTPVELEDRQANAGRSPLEQAIDGDALQRYEEALKRLAPLYREAVIARIEMQNSYEEIARALGKPNANAARSLVVRALYKLYQEMGHDG
jgi:RNA polymerase sigma factor (sigma-70 family)